MSTMMTTKEYAKKIKNCTPQAVRKAIKKNKMHNLPQVKKITKIGRDYLLELAS